MYSMNNYWNLFADGLTEWLLEAGFIQSQCQMSIYYKYALDGTIFVFYLTLMTMYIGILMNILENGLQII